MRRRGHATVNCCGKSGVYDSSCKILSVYLWIFQNATSRNVEDIFKATFLSCPAFSLIPSKPANVDVYSSSRPA
jgi:hypothetical protein